MANRSSRKRKRRRPRAAPPPPVAVASDDRARAEKKRAAATQERPQPPWGTFPLSEIVVLIGMVLLLAGFFIQPPRGPIMIGAGLILASLAGLELAVREHLAGYRSHSTLLAGAGGAAVVALLLVFAGETVPPVAALAAGVLVFALAAWGWATLFRRRSGGALFKLRG
ncbi:MAG: hypothetical protein EXQ70_05135 [Solirubrobacterales bacterium]|nr:hypothetical protein [Solirubrobacterales bacterium]